MKFKDITNEMLLELRKELFPDDCEKWEISFNSVRYFMFLYFDEKGQIGTIVSAAHNHTIKLQYTPVPIPFIKLADFFKRYDIEYVYDDY